MPCKPPSKPRAAQLLTQYRKELGLTVQQFADRIGVPRTRASEYLTGRRRVPRDKLLVVSRVCNCPIEDLL